MEFGRKNKTRAKKKKKEYNVVAFLGFFFLFASQVSLLQSSIESKIDLEKRLGNLKKKGNEETHK